MRSPRVWGAAAVTTATLAPKRKPRWRSRSPSALDCGEREEFTHAYHPPERLGDSRTARHARGAVSRPALGSGRARRRGRGGGLRPAGACGRPGSLGRALSGQAQPGLYARPRRHAGEVQSQLQQLLRVQHQQADRRERAEDPSLDGEARRPRREGADGRHRCADQDDGARGAALPSPLRRGLVDGDCRGPGSR